jgi:membrane protease YdiL (CAAX protease family)
MQRSGGFLSRYSLVIGIILMFLFTWPIDLANAGLMPFQVPFALYLFLGWGFGLAAALMTWATLGWPAVVQLYKRYLVWRVGWKWYAALFIVPAIMTLAVYLNAVLTGTPPDFSRVMADNIRPEGVSRLAFVLPFLLIELIANGEEIGWRGYVLPRLQAKYSALTAALVTGVIWGLWHIPKFLTHWDWTYFALFMLDTIAKSVLLAWIYNGTRGSLLMVVLAHGIWNTAGIVLPTANTLSSEGIGAFALQTLMEIVVAAVIVARTGAANLSRTETRQMQA